MRLVKAIFLLSVCLVMLGGIPVLAHAAVSEQFFRDGDEIYDDWGVFRTRADGSDGFLGVTSTGFDPLLVYEGLGDNADLAWRAGEEFIRKYPDEYQRAEKIFYFVRDRVRYTSDSDQFGTGEFAQNADEMAIAIKRDGKADGDCEDSSVLLAVLYKAAGYRSAIVLMPGHVATLVHLPGYSKAPRNLSLDGENGWIWAEATGATNRFGWVPTSVLEEQMFAREVTIAQGNNQEPGAMAVSIEGGVPIKGKGSSSGNRILTFLAPVGFLWLVSGGRRRTSQRRSR